MRGPVVLRSGRHSRRWRRVASRHRLRRMRPGVAAVLVVAACASVAAVVVVGGGRPASAAPQPYGGTCPGGGNACVQVSLPCQSSPCPSVVAGPTQNLATGQFVYLALSDYPAGDTVRLAFCATDGSGTIAPDPYCATTTPGGLKLNKQYVDIGVNGSTEASVPVDFDPAGQGNPALTGVPLVVNGQPNSSFFCDNGPDFCAVVITDDGPTTGAGPTDTAANTVIVPLTFAPGASACPTADAQLYSDSSFTVEQLIPAMVQATCSQKNGVVTLNTATNTASEISDLVSGGTPVAFSDDPWDAQLNEGLTSGSATYAYIPVALSATVVGFLGGAPDETRPGVVFPLAQYDMTPNMVAGVLTTAYEGGGTVDNLVTAPANHKAPLNCKQIVGCSQKTEVEFNTFYMLNPEPTGVGQPGEIGSFFSNTASGTSYQLSDWLCSAPNAPFELSVQKKGASGPEQVSVTDTYNTAAGTLTTPPTQSPFWNPTTNPSLWPFKTCAPTSQFPTLSPGSLTQYQPADTPALQAKSIRAYGASGNLAFGAMDWSEASFNGLNVVALQNAAGNFVTPSQASIDAAMTDAVKQSNGTYTFDYDDKSNTGAYPMPMVTYAVVPTAPIPAAQAQSLSQLLTNLVTFSSGKSGTLPGGYVPLPSALVTQATQDIAHDIVAQPTSSSGSSGAGASAASGATGSASSGSGAPSQTGVGASQLTGSAVALGTSATSEDTGTSGKTRTPGTSRGAGTGATSSRGVTSGSSGVGGPLAAGFDVIVGGTRFVLPALMAAAAAAVIAGPVVWAWPRRRRRPAIADDAEIPDDGGAS